MADINTDFNCWNSFTLTRVERVTTGTQSFALVIANVVVLSSLQIKQFSTNLNQDLLHNLLVVFQEFSKNYLKTLMVQLYLGLSYQHY